jgi:hypothetical protein
VVSIYNLRIRTGQESIKRLSHVQGMVDRENRGSPDIWI